MHEGELELSEELVRGLLVEQRPDLLVEPVTSVASHGTVNALFRTGGLVCRLRLVPVPEDAARASIDREIRVARAMARVGIATPEPVFRGEPTSSYPMPWLVWRWIDGDTATPGVGESDPFATDLARFVL